MDSKLDSRCQNCSSRDPLARVEGGARDRDKIFEIGKGFVGLLETDLRIVPLVNVSKGGSGKCQQRIMQLRGHHVILLFSQFSKSSQSWPYFFLSFFQGGNLSGIEDSFRFGEGSIVDECDREPTL